MTAMVIRIINNTPRKIRLVKWEFVRSSVNFKVMSPAFYTIGFPFIHMLPNSLRFVNEEQNLISAKQLEAWNMRTETICCKMTNLFLCFLE